MNIIIRRNGKTVSTSKNLRGIIGYSRNAGPRFGRTLMHRVNVSTVHVLETPSGALLRVRWEDGAYATAHFASCTTARRFCYARRTWPMHRYTPLHHWHAATRAD